MKYWWFNRDPGSLCHSKWVGFHPLYTLNNQGPCFHCSISKSPEGREKGRKPKVRWKATKPKLWWSPRLSGWELFGGNSWWSWHEGFDEVDHISPNETMKDHLLQRSHLLYIQDSFFQVRFSLLYFTKKHFWKSDGFWMMVVKHPLVVACSGIGTLSKVYLWKRARINTHLRLPAAPPPNLSVTWVLSPPICLQVPRPNGIHCKRWVCEKNWVNIPAPDFQRAQPGVD